MKVPERGALVMVQFTGEVRDGVEDRGGFWLQVPYDALLRTPETTSFVPPTATVQVVRPARPREVLLLCCGHAMDQLVPAAASGEQVYCWRQPCQSRKRVDRVGSVTW